MTTIIDHVVCLNDQPLRGVLIASDPQYEIWFPYSIEAIKLLRENLIIGVRNISSINLHRVTDADEDAHYSLLRIAAVTPRHFLVDQIRHDRANEPISIEDLISKFDTEWKRSVRDREQNNLRLVVSADNTGLELYLPLGAAAFNQKSDSIGDARSNPILGDIVFLMNQSVVDRLVNRHLAAPGPDNNIIALGTHTLYTAPPLQVLLDTDEFFNRHFGIFGFTGAGKSNLLSTLVASTMETSSQTNLVLFDVNNEYFGLLFDVLLRHDAHVVFCDDSLIGASLRMLLQGNMQFLEAAAQEFIDTTTMSSALLDACETSADLRENLIQITKLLLASGCFKVLRLAETMNSVGSFFSDLQQHIATSIKVSGTGMRAKNEFLQSIAEQLSPLLPDESQDLTPEHLETLRASLKQLIDYTASDQPVAAADQSGSTLFSTLCEKFPKEAKDRGYRDLAKPLRSIDDFLQKTIQNISRVEEDYKITIGLDGLLNTIQDAKRTVVIMLGQENSLRNFSNLLGDFVYNFRRDHGINKPLTSFIFDEADLFIPAKTDKKDEDDADAIRSSRSIANTLARRGRKYGLGLGIATQRLTYLDTGILAQLSSYFVGKLPRLSDRTRIAEGFGIEQSNLQSGISTTGDWVVLSHTAVGDKGAPIPVHFDNADTRLTAFLTDFDMGLFPDLANSMQRADYVSDLENHRGDLTRPVTSTDYLP